MTNSPESPSSDRPPTRSPKGKTSDKYARLRAEAIAPYRGLRKFIYLACGASGAIGAMIFLLQLLAGRGAWTTLLPNLALQLGIVALMIGLFRLDRASDQSSP